MPKKDVAILDFGSEKITVVIGSRDVNNTFAVLGRGEAEYAGFMDGEFLAISELKLAMGMAISNAEVNSKTYISDIYVGVPTEFSFCLCKNISQNYPKQKVIKQRDIDELYERANDFKEYNSHSVVNQSSIYFVLDNGNKVNNPVGHTTSSLSACLSYILVENNFINLINSFIVDLDLSKVIYISSELAQAQYIFDEDVRERYALLVDCGYITTSVSLIRGNGLLCLNSFSMGGGHITADLSECLKIPFSAAEALKRKAVLSIEPNKGDVYEISIDGNVVPMNAKNVNDIIKARIDDIARMILKCLSVCKYEYPDYTPIHLTGGGLCYLKGAKDYLSKLTGKNIEFIDIPVTQLNKPHLSSCVGLLDAALKQEELSKRTSAFGGFFKKLKGLFK